MVFVDKHRIEWFPGMTVAQLLDRLDDGGNYAVVRMNGQLICRPNFAATQVPQHATLEPIPMVAGG